MYETITQDLLAFLAASPSCYHVVSNIGALLTGAGYRELSEAELWRLAEGGRYYSVRNGSSLIAFRLPRQDFTGFQIAATHSDSPCFKIKVNPEMPVREQYVVLNTEKYGGMLCAPWFDRPLSVAGRIVCREHEALSAKLVNVDRDLLMIPSLALHMDRTANDGRAYNAQKDMLPLLGDFGASGRFMDIVADAAGVNACDILGMDLFLYNRVPGTVWGADNEFVSAGRLDDLQCTYASLRAFLDADNPHSVPVLAVFDNEEVGSATRQGAASTMLTDVLRRINDACGRSQQQYLSAVAASFMASTDNAHALHPNHEDCADPINRPAMNKGVVIKYNADQKYTTDGVSAAIFKQLCGRAHTPWQEFTNRSDSKGGSTLGNISSTQVPLCAVDIGLAQLAMHSPYETAGGKDAGYLASVLRCLYSSALRCEAGGRYRLLFP